MNEPTDSDLRQDDVSRPKNARIEALVSSVSAEFTATKRVLDFDEWFQLLCDEPRTHARNAAQYVRDAFDHFGHRPVRTPSGRVRRFSLFDRPFDSGHRLVGQEAAQNEFYEAIDGFCRLGRVDSLVLLHGPNGSAKSTLLECVQRAVEVYSHTDRGALYRFSWIFPTREAQSGGIGFGGGGGVHAGRSGSYARLDGEALDARLSDEHKDPPLFLIPTAERRRLLEDICAPFPSFVLSETVQNGDLSARNRQIFDALLAQYQGDLRRVYEHVRVERFFLSGTYRSGVVDVEPKQTVDARSFPVTGDRAFASLPPSVGGQVLFGMQGDLVDANRGIINFSDLLKRPYEHYKYLLTGIENARVALDHVVLGLDVVFTGSANDINLLEFRAGRSAEFQSFRARLQLIPVPYLLDYRVERKIYEEQVGDVLRGIHIAPFVSRILALWAVMTRLRRPDPERYDERLRDVLRRLTPLEKADLYSYGRVPEGLSNDEARELLAAVPDMHHESFPHAAVRAEGSDHLLGDYEGSFGASVRDMKGLLLAAASSSERRCVTVPGLFEEIREFLGDKVNHRWMALESGGAGFHKYEGEGSITESAWERWLDLTDGEVREALGLVDEARYLELFRKYIVHAKHHVKKERIFDEVTGQLTDPDEKFMKDLERAMDNSSGDGFRAEVLARIGAWALSHPHEEPAYEEIFPDFFARLREDYYRQQKGNVAKGIQFMLELLRDEAPRETDLELSPAEKTAARHALEVLLGKHDRSEDRERHTEETLREALVQLSKYRY
ncbi:MAG: serine protein kinase PrkA [Myxococcales bacterium FL481]|nr:MAG: serine protein kinase PrkA [Myxococcales bacterium FL481]